MKKALLFLAGLVFAPVIFCQEVDIKVIEPTEFIIPEKFTMFVCTDEPVIYEKEPVKETDPTKKDPAVTNEETTTQADEYCMSILYKCKLNLACVAEIDPLLEKRIRKRAGNISTDKEEIIKLLLSGLKMEIVKVNLTKIQFRLKDNLGRTLYKRDLRKAGPQLFSSQLVKGGKFSRAAVDNYQKQKTLTNKAKAVASLWNSFSITISPDYKSR